MVQQILEKVYGSSTSGRLNKTLGKISEAILLAKL